MLRWPDGNIPFDWSDLELAAVQNGGVASIGRFASSSSSMGVSGMSGVLLSSWYSFMYIGPEGLHGNQVKC